MRFYKRLAIGILFIASMNGYAAEQKDFFDIIEVEPLEEGKEECDKRQGNCNVFRMSGDIGYRFQYAIQDQQTDYNFFRTESGVSSSRADAALQAD